MFNFDLVSEEIKYVILKKCIQSTSIVPLWYISQSHFCVCLYTYLKNAGLFFRTCYSFQLSTKSIRCIYTNHVIWHFPQFTIQSTANYPPLFVTRRMTIFRQSIRNVYFTVSRITSLVIKILSLTNFFGEKISRSTSFPQPLYFSAQEKDVNSYSDICVSNGTIVMCVYVYVCMYLREYIMLADLLLPLLRFYRFSTLHGHPFGESPSARKWRSSRFVQLIENVLYSISTSVCPLFFLAFFARGYIGPGAYDATPSTMCSRGFLALAFHSSSCSVSCSVEMKGSEKQESLGF